MTHDCTAVLQQYNYSNNRIAESAGGLKSIKIRNDVKWNQVNELHAKSSYIENTISSCIGCTTTYKLVVIAIYPTKYSICICPLYVELVVSF